jgi:hypothetical protein
MNLTDTIERAKHFLEQRAQIDRELADLRELTNLLMNARQKRKKKSTPQKDTPFPVLK